MVDDQLVTGSSSQDDEDRLQSEAHKSDAVSEANTVSEEDAIEVVLDRVAKSDPMAAVQISEYIVQSSNQGPMPSPEAIKGYALTQKDFPERMMVMAETTLVHKARHADALIELKQKELAIDEQQIKAENMIDERHSVTQRINIAVAGVIVLICITGSFYLALQDKTEVALVIGGATVVGIVGSFLRGNKPKK